MSIYDVLYWGGFDPNNLEPPSTKSARAKFRFRRGSENVKQIRLVVRDSTGKTAFVSEWIDVETLDINTTYDLESYLDFLTIGDMAIVNLVSKQKIEPNQTGSLTLSSGKTYLIVVVGETEDQYATLSIPELEKTITLYPIKSPGASKGARGILITDISENLTLNYDTTGGCTLYVMEIELVSESFPLIKNYSVELYEISDPTVPIAISTVENLASLSPGCTLSLDVSYVRPSSMVRRDVLYSRPVSLLRIDVGTYTRPPS